MSDSIYSFRAGPTYRGATQQETLTAALEMPMSRTSTFFDQAKGGILESFGLGTAIRDISIPEGKQEEDDGEFGVRDAMEMLSPHPLIRTYELAKRGVQSLINDEGSPALSEDAYKSSAWYREGVPWDQAMTEQRASALAESFDAKKVREFYAEKRPITAFIGNLAGQAADPINYIPVAGPAVKAAAVARLGRVAGASVAASLDAAANTAIFGVATAGTRARFGDDVSWQTTVSQIATAALIGAGFGSIAGALEGRGAAVSRSAIEERLATLKTTQEARIALNEGIDALVRGEDVRLSPNATEPVARVAQRAEDAAASLPRAVSDAAGNILPVREGELPIRGLAVANKYERGDVYIGKPGEVHFQISERNPFEKAGMLAETGFVNPDGIFLSRSQALDWVSTNEKKVRPDENMAAGQLDALDYREQVPESKKAGPSPRASDSSLTRTASWVIRDKQTQSPVMETFSPAVVARLNTGKYEAVPIGQYLGEINGRPKPAPVVDTTPARADPLPEGTAEAEKAIAKPDDYKALSNQYRVDPDTGTFAEDADIAQLAAEGRLTEEDASVLADAQAVYDDGAAYGEALKSVAGCLI